MTTKLLFLLLGSRIKVGDCRFKISYTIYLSVYFKYQTHTHLCRNSECEWGCERHGRQHIAEASREECASGHRTWLQEPHPTAGSGPRGEEWPFQRVRQRTMRPPEDQRPREYTALGSNHITLLIQHDNFLLASIHLNFNRTNQIQTNIYISP